MKIISMAWTAGAFVAWRKRATRRKWKDSYAAMFKPGDVCQVYDRSPRVGGKRIGWLVIESIGKERIGSMPDEDFELEGFGWMEEAGVDFRGMPAREAFEAWRRSDPDEMYWVIRFSRLVLTAGEGKESVKAGG